MIPLKKLYSLRNNARINGIDGLAVSLEELLDALIEDAENPPRIVVGPDYRWDGPVKPGKHTQQFNYVPTTTDNPDTSAPSDKPDKLSEWGTSKGLDSKPIPDRT